jgi:hypothetical protein
MTSQSSQLVRLNTNRPPDGNRRLLFGLDTEALAGCMAEIGEP